MDNKEHLTRPLHLSPRLLSHLALLCSSSTVQPLSAPLWTVPPIFFFFHTLNPWQQCCCDEQPLTFWPACSQNKGQKLWRDRRTRGRRRTRGWRIWRNERGNNGKVSGMEALRRDLLCQCVPESHKEGRVTTRTVDCGQCQGCLFNFLNDRPLLHCPAKIPRREKCISGLAHSPEMFQLLEVEYSSRLICPKKQKEGKKVSLTKALLS